MKSTVVIVGAGLAGVSAATALRADGFDGRLVLVGGECQLPYDRPPLSKGILLGEQTPADILLYQESFYVDNDIELVLGAPVTGIAPAERKVHLATGASLVADRLLLCTGGSPRRLSLPGDHLEGIHYLRSLDDALAIQDQLQIHGSLVVVGAGFIGAEVAAAARERGCPVTLLEVTPRPLGQALGDAIGDVYAQLHRDRGVDLRTGVGVAAFNGPDRVWEVITTEGEAIPADVVVVGVGMKPDTQLAEDAGLVVDDGIVVDEFGQTSIEGVFAAGDVARRFDPRSGRYVRHEHWQNARRHAMAVAGTMTGRRQPYDEVPWFWSDQYGVNLQTAGEPRAGTAVVFRGDIESTSFTAFSLDGDRVVGVIGVNRPRDVRAAMSLIEHRVPVDAAVLSDDDVDLRQLAKRLLAGS
jgi:3-phenylpropionate/trans-cinnamate dioxygenase ferredoxin reductase component